MESHKIFCPGWAGTLILPISAFKSLRWQACNTIGWDGGLTNFPGLASNCDSPNLSLQCS
jgi:hypothetical protein